MAPGRQPGRRPLSPPDLPPQLSPDELELAARFDAACDELTDSAVAAIIGASETRAAAYRAGSERLPAVAVLRLCTALGVAPEDILGG